MKMKKILSILVVLGLMAPGLAACGGNTPPPQSEATKNEAKDTAKDTTAAAADDDEETKEAEESVEVGENDGVELEEGQTIDENGVIRNEDGTIVNPEILKMDGSKLVFWSLFSGGDGEFMDKIIDSYNATSPTKQVQSVMLVWGDYYTKFATAVASGNAPDIGVSHASRLPELQEQGMIMEFDSYAEEASVDWSKFTDEMNASVIFDGAHYAMPLDVHAEVMYMNLDILEEAGVTEDEVRAVKSESDFTKILDKVKDVTAEDQTVISLPTNGDDPYRVWWAEYFQMGGTPIVNEDSSEVTLDRDIAIKAAEAVKAYYDNGYVMTGITDHGKIFQNGLAGFAWAGTWSVGAFEQSTDLNFSVAPFPSLYNGGEACWADAHTLTIPVSKTRSDEDTVAAVEFIYYAAGEGATTWAQSGQIPANLDVVESSGFKALTYRSGYSRAAQTAVLPPLSPVFGGLKSAIITNLDEYWSDQTDVETVVDNIIADMETEL